MHYRSGMSTGRLDSIIGQTRRLMERAFNRFIHLHGFIDPCLQESSTRG
jgi:hypothetical protein